MEQTYTEKVIFAGGCFWCTEHDLKSLPGVVDVIAGYSGGDFPKPNYYDVVSEKTHHRECVEVTYNASIISYRKLCQFFLDHIDPTDSGGQFYDRGESYKTAIFYSNNDEKQTAYLLLRELEESGLYAPLKVAVDVLPTKPFYPAEIYHQNYAEKNSGHYAMYVKASGRARFVTQTCEIRKQKKIVWKD